MLGIYIFKVRYTISYRAVCCSRRLDILARLMGGLMGTITLRFWRVIYKVALHFMTRPKVSSSSRTIIPNTLARRPKIGSKTMIWKSYYGAQSPDLNPIEHL